MFLIKLIYLIQTIFKVKSIAIILDTNRVQTHLNQNEHFDISCSKETDFSRSQLFQMYIRAGMENEIREILENCGPDILNANFLIHLKLPEFNEKIMGNESSVRSFVKIGNTVPGYYNSILQINPFHLAVVAQQYKSVKCILGLYLYNYKK